MLIDIASSGFSFLLMYHVPKYRSIHVLGGYPTRAIAGCGGSLPKFLWTGRGPAVGTYLPKYSNHSILDYYIPRYLPRCLGAYLPRQAIGALSIILLRPMCATACVIPNLQKRDCPVLFLFLLLFFSEASTLPFLCVLSSASSTAITVLQLTPAATTLPAKCHISTHHYRN